MNQNQIHTNTSRYMAQSIVVIQNELYIFRFHH